MSPPIISFYFGLRTIQHILVSITVFLAAGQLDTKANEHDPLKNDPTKTALDIQTAKLNVPLRLSDEQKEAFGLRIATYLRSAWLTEIHQTPSNLERVFQMALDNFEASIDETRLPGQQREGIMIRLNKQLYHHFKMNFKETHLRTKYTAFGSFLEPSQEDDFEIEEVFEDASEGFVRDLSE